MAAALETNAAQRINGERSTLCAINI